MLTEATIYWDTQDPTNEGWAYRAKHDDGREESGEWAGPLPPDADGTALQEAVTDLAYQCGEKIETGDVAAEPTIDGGYAQWHRAD